MKTLWETLEAHVMMMLLSSCARSGRCSAFKAAAASSYLENRRTLSLMACGRYNKKEKSTPYGNNILAAAAAAALSLGTASWCMSAQEWLDQPMDKETAKAVSAYENDSWVRVDQALVKSGSSGVLGTLGAETNAVKMYRIYAKSDGSEVVAVAKFGGPGSTGHPGIVHGGVTALLFDNTLGFAQGVSALRSDDKLHGFLEALQSEATLGNSETTASRFGFTASLTINYRSPCFSKSTVVINCKLVEANGRKRTLKGTMIDSKTGKLVADSSALFIMPRPKKSLWTRLSSYFVKTN